MNDEFSNRRDVLAALNLAGQPLPLDDIISATQLTYAAAAAAAWSLVRSRHAFHRELLREGAAFLEPVFVTRRTNKIPAGGRLLDTSNGLLWEAAIHEASHSAVARQCGGFTVRLTAREGGSGEITVALPEVNGKPPHAATVAFHLAGAAAEWQMENDGAAAVEDEARALAAAEAGGISPKLFAILRENTRRQVVRLWPQILCVAADLLTARSVTGDAAMKLVEQAYQRSNRS